MSAPTPVVYGAVVDAQTRCIHYCTELDVIAIEFACCRAFYPCHLCHAEHAGHPAQQWPLDQRHQEAILCGVCSTRLRIDDYLATDTCPSCTAAFNPRCALHAHLYFTLDTTGRAG